jgi:class 3 adenylate cyclase
MMTDIKGFTNRTSGYSRDQIEELLRSHEQLLTPIFTKHDGTVIKTIGDAFLVTFESATNAIEAGMDIQRALSANNTRVSENDQLLVRVAVNAGEVNLRDGDIFGEPVNITARVESISKAEHVTFTETVRLQLNKDSIPYIELGEFSLKGIPKPVTLYRVKHDWAVDSSFADGESLTGGGPSQSAVNGNDERSDPSGSSAYAAIGAFIIAILLIVFMATRQGGSSLASSRKLIENKEYTSALNVLKQVLLKAPANKDALSLKRLCETALIDEHIESGKVFEAIETGNKLIVSTTSPNEISDFKSKLIKATKTVIAEAIKTGSLEYARKCLDALDLTMADDLTAVECRIRFEMINLDKIYKSSLAKKSEGASAMLISLREQSFDQIIAGVRSKLHIDRALDHGGEFKAGVARFIPLLDYYDAFGIILKFKTFTPTDLIDNSIDVKAKASKSLNQLARAYEKDASLREDQALGDAFLNLLKFFDTDAYSMTDSVAIQLRRTISTFIVEWMAPLMIAESLKGPHVDDGTKCEEAAWRLRHNTEMILGAAGKLNMLDKKAMLLLDFGWFKQYDRNDGDLRERLEQCEAFVVGLKDTSLTTAFESVIKDLKDRFKIKWGEK